MPKTVSGRICTVVLAVAIGCALWICLPPSFVSGVEVSFDVRAERDFLCSAYYKERSGGPLGRVNAYVRAGETRVHLLIPAARVERLRIDYGEKPGHVEISPVKLSGEGDEVLPWRDFNAFNDIGRYEIRADGWLSLDSEGSDPYAVFGKALDVPARRSVNWGAVVLRVMLLLAVAGVLFWRARDVADVCRWGVRFVVARSCALCRWLHGRFRAWLTDPAFPLRSVVIVTVVVVMGGGICAWLPPTYVSGVKVSFDVRAERDFLCSAYYKERGDGSLGRVNTYVRAGESCVSLLIPADRVEWLRIDYGEKPGHVEASPVRMLGVRDEVLDWRDFNVFHDIGRHDILADGWLSLDSERSDPNVVCGKKLDASASRHFNRNAVILHVLLLIAVAGVLLWRKRDVAGVCKWCVRFATARFYALCAESRAWLPSCPFAIYMVVVILLAWGFELFNFTYSIDDEMVLYGGFGIDGWLMEGRWGMFLLSSFYGNSSVPVFAFALTLFFYSLSFVLLFNHLGKVRYFLFPVYIAFPGIYMSFSFTSLNPGVGLAFFLAALAVRLSESGIAALCFAPLLGAMAIGCYQIFAFFLMIAVIIRCIDGAYLAERFSWRDFLVSALRGCLLVLLSYAVYRAVSYGFQEVTGIKEDYIAKHYLKPPQNLAEWRAWCPLALRRVYWLLAGEAGVYPITMWSFRVLLIGGMSVTALWMVFGQRPPLVRLVLFAAGCSVLLSAFLPLAFNDKAGAPDRVLVLLIPVAVAGMLSQAARCLARIRSGLVLGAVTCALCAFQFIWALNQMTYSNFLQNKHDAAFVAMVRERVETLPEVAMRRFKGDPVPLLLVGRNEFNTGGPAVVPSNKPWGWPVWSHDHIGATLLTEPRRFCFSIKTFLGTHYEYADALRISQSTVQFIENMPIWPLKGSVVWKDGLVIVKFTDFSPRPAWLPRWMSRKQCLCTEARINGFDELTFTDVDAGNLLHRYPAGVTLGVNDFTFPPYRTAEPYLILEIRTEAEGGSGLILWRGHERQECKFILRGGVDVLRLRVPSEFLAVPLQAQVSTAGVAVKILELNVYSDRKFTERMLKLNPELRASLLSAAAPRGSAKVLCRESLLTCK